MRGVSDPMATSPGRTALLDSEAPPVDEVTVPGFRRAGEGDSPSQTTRPSHVAPSLAAQCEAHVQAALGACVTTEARLGALFRAVQHISAGVSSAREANDQLAFELEALRSLLAASNEQQMELRHRIAMLEQALVRAEQQAAREREQLIEQQDAFLLLLLNDHEREVAELLRLRLERDQLRGDLERVQAQRDEAQAAVVRIASERDQALIELSRTRSSERMRAAVTPRADSAPVPVAKLELEGLPKAPASAPVSSTPGPASSPSTQVPSTKPALKQKPDPSTRPLIGYSLGEDDVAAEQLEITKVSPRPQDR